MFDMNFSLESFNLESFSVDKGVTDEKENEQKQEISDDVVLDPVDDSSSDASAELSSPAPDDVVEELELVEPEVELSVEENYERLKSEIQQAEKDCDEIDADLEELNKEISKLQERKRALNERRFPARRNLVAVKKEFEQAEILYKAEQSRKELSNSVLGLINSDLSELPTFNSLFEHQVVGAATIINARRIILGDDTGTGKTATTFSALAVLRNTGKADKILIVSPSDLVTNLHDELGMWAPGIQAVPMYRYDAYMRDAFLSTVQDHLDQWCILVNFEALRDEKVYKKIMEMGPDTIVVDEAHTIRNKATQMSAAVNSIALGSKRKDGSEGCDNIILMTATSVVNKPDDFYTLLYLILPTIFTDINSFRVLYCEPVVRDSGGSDWVFKAGAMSRIKYHLQGRYLARGPEVIADKVPYNHPIEDVVITMDEMETCYSDQLDIMKQLSEYAQVVLSEGSISANNVLELLMRKRQANVYPAGIPIYDLDTREQISTVGDEITDNVKMDYVLKMISEDPNAGWVVFSQFVGANRELERRLNDMGISAVAFDGSTREDLRQEIKRDFNRRYTSPSEAKYKVVLANYKTGGVGLNFTRATKMILTDLPWNWASVRQAIARISRIGQTEETRVYSLVIEKTIDKWMSNLVLTKKDIADSVTSIGKEAAAELLLAMKSGEMI